MARRAFVRCSEARAHKETSGTRALARVCCAHAHWAFAVCCAARELVLREESKRLRVALEAAMKKLQRHISDDDSNSVDRRIVIQLLVTYLTCVGLAARFGAIAHA